MAALALARAKVGAEAAAAAESQDDASDGDSEEEVTEPCDKNPTRCTRRSGLHFEHRVGVCVCKRPPIASTPHTSKSHSSHRRGHRGRCNMPPPPSPQQQQKRSFDQVHSAMADILGRADAEKEVCARLAHDDTSCLLSFHLRPLLSFPPGVLRCAVAGAASEAQDRQGDCARGLRTRERDGAAVRAFERAPVTTPAPLANPAHFPHSRAHSQPSHRRLWFPRNRRHRSTLETAVRAMEAASSDAAAGLAAYEKAEATAKKQRRP